MALEVPKLLTDRARGWGGAIGEQWLAGLPRVIDDLSQRWGLDVGPPIPSHISFVAPAVRGRDAPTVLKIPMKGVDFPHAQGNNRHFEPAALGHWAGLGSVALLDFDAASGAMLLEQCVPGTRLADVATLDEADRVAADLLTSLWRSPPRDPVLTTTADLALEWARRMPVFRRTSQESLDSSLFEDAAVILEEFAARTPSTTLLHGDFHHNNVLSASRESWLAIDPLPLVGDREYDAVMFLLFRKGSMSAPESELAGAIASFCALLDLDTEAVKKWMFARLVCDALASLALGATVSELEMRQEDIWSARLIRSLTGS